jgi:hypothetical protein
VNRTYRPRVTPLAKYQSTHTRQDVLDRVATGARERDHVALSDERGHGVGDAALRFQLPQVFERLLCVNARWILLPPHGELFEPRRFHVGGEFGGIPRLERDAEGVDRDGL